MVPGLNVEARLTDSSRQLCNACYQRLYKWIQKDASNEKEEHGRVVFEVKEDAPDEKER